ncbi:aminoglycoside phosphotransferase [Bacillus clarus]|uniref:Aminoglycoside phosphotransferase n=1 Tax=Bacillus clarus TaxID=2338372 RepID=A0A090YL32_9BACI|nr:phosphotransferase [Bacillus clarus]KFM98597.1 phosphotransferase enzyme family protein [Bacillus clarus]RFT64981.1 aminoglycoside phosphotransferase [Bacillus clarus]
MKQVLEIAKYWFQDDQIKAKSIGQKVIKITSNKQNYILKEKGSIKQLLAEIHTVEQLYKKDIEVQKLVKTRNSESYVVYKDKYYCMYEYIDGSVVEVKRVERLRELGDTIGNKIAKLHQALYSINHVDELIKCDLYKVVYEWAMPILEKNEQVHPEVIQKMYQLQKNLKEHITSLPKQIIHRDIHLSNLIFNDNEFQGFIDFELLEGNVRIFDLCYCFTSMLSELFTDDTLRRNWLHIVRNIFEGYYKQNALIREEFQAIWYVMLSIQIIFITYFVHSADLLKLNEEMFLWIFANKEAIENVVDPSYTTNV